MLLKTTAGWLRLVQHDNWYKCDHKTAMWCSCAVTKCCWFIIFVSRLYRWLATCVLLARREKLLVETTSALLVVLTCASVFDVILVPLIYKSFTRCLFVCLSVCLSVILVPLIYKSFTRWWDFATPNIRYTIRYDDTNERSRAEQ